MTQPIQFSVSPGAAPRAAAAMPNTAPSAPAPKRARLALVLGSGGVRSVAALGLVERLAREGIQPDLIVGCSSGALFGAAIAMGLPPHETLEAANRLWSPDLTQQRRWRAYLQLVAPRLTGFGQDFGLRDNTAIAARLNEFFGQRLLEQMPIPMRVSATEAATGRPIVLSQGPAARAVLASMAVPFIFPSVEVDGRWLVDGVVSDPLPVQAAADADLVLTLGFEGGMPRRVDRVSRLAAQASTTLINNLMQARLDAAHARGQALIHLTLSMDRRVGLWETRAIPYVYEAGRRAADAYLPQILGKWDLPARRAAA